MPNLPTLDELRSWLAAGDVDAIRHLAEEAHPHDIAELFADLDDEEAWALLRAMSSPEDGAVFSNLGMDRQARLAEYFDDREVASLLEHVAPDDRIDLIQQLEPEQQQSILAQMAEPERRETERLGAYPEGTVGSVMSTDFVTLRARLTVGEAIAQLRQQAEQKETIFYNYVVDRGNRLLGIVSLKDLVLSKPEVPLDALMDTEVVTVRAEDDREDAARIIQEYDLIALPVVHGDNRLLGIVTVDDVIDVQQAEVTEDFHKLGGVATLDQPYLTTSIMTLVRKRVGWLAILFAAGLLTIAAMGSFEKHIDMLPVLAVFVPLIIASGGNSGSQAATLMTRAMALREVELKHFGHVVRRELIGGLMLGVTLACIGFVMATLVGMWTFAGDEEALLPAVNVGLAVGMSVISVVLFGNMVGSMLPFILVRVGLDPATGSTPFVATVVDVAGLLIYFTIATWWLAGYFPQAPPVAAIP